MSQLNLVNSYSMFNQLIMVGLNKFVSRFSLCLSSSECRFILVSGSFLFAQYSHNYRQKLLVFLQLKKYGPFWTEVSEVFLLPILRYIDYATTNVIFACLIGQTLS